MSLLNIHFLSPATLQNVYASTFFKWTIRHENDKKRAKMLKVYGINMFFYRSAPSKRVFCTLCLTLTIIDGRPYRFNVPP